MPEFSKEELNLIFLYDPGNLPGLIYELRSMMNVLMPDEKTLYTLTKNTIRKLEQLTSADYESLSDSFDCDLDLSSELIEKLIETEE